MNQNTQRSNEAERKDFEKEFMERAGRQHSWGQMALLELASMGAESGVGGESARV